MTREMAEATVDNTRAARQEAAVLASDARQFPRAAEQWNALRIDFPDEALYWRKAGEAYCEMGMFDRADEIVEAALAAFPEDLWIAHRHTVVAQRRADWVEALRRADSVWQRFPDHAIGYVLRGEVLREMGRLDEADAAFAAAVEHFPEDEWARRGYAELASRRRAWTEALERWQAVRERFPHLVRAQSGLAEALAELNRPDEAEAAVAEVILREPDNAEARAIRPTLARHRSPREVVVQRIRERGI